MAKTFLMINKKHFWSIIFATVAIIKKLSAEKEVLYQTPKKVRWGWFPHSNTVPGVSGVSIFFIIFIYFHCCIAS